MDILYSSGFKEEVNANQNLGKIRIFRLAVSKGKDFWEEYRPLEVARGAAVFLK